MGSLQHESMQHANEDALWNGDLGAGGISWAQRSKMGPLRGVIDAADTVGRRNAYMHALHKTIVQRALKRARPRRALDFGCGTGRFIPILSSRCADVHAIDKEYSMVRAARRHTGAYKAAIQHWAGRELQFETAFFDFILCSSVLCVTTPALFQHSLSEMARVCRPGGVILLLEQVKAERGLTVQTYEDALANAGFTTYALRPIRSAASRITSFVTKTSCIPSQFYGGVAVLEIAVTSRLRANDPTVPYVEYAIEARRATSGK